ncbi:hypothetical protein JKG47_12595 [Acidithiobacillus sp. MC6.1]|nr:hypothetical protein [Acidithiobacillus sp. MC6.1]
MSLPVDVDRLAHALQTAVDVIRTNGVVLQTPDDIEFLGAASTIARIMETRAAAAPKPFPLTEAQIINRIADALGVSVAAVRTKGVSKNWLEKDVDYQPDVPNTGAGKNRRRRMYAMHAVQKLLKNDQFRRTFRKKKNR